MDHGIDAAVKEAVDRFPDFELFTREFFLGGSRTDPSAERREFLAHLKKVQEVQQHLADESDGVRRRVFHAKSHGALLGELRLRPDRPPGLRHGIFGDVAPASYPVLARFSNGKGIIERDIIPDVRGVALKIFNVSPGEPARTMDLLLTNSPVAFGRDHAEFVDFMVASQSKPGLVKFLLSHPAVARALLKASAHPPIGGITCLTFWGGHAYLLGPERAMKLKLAPEMDEESFLERAAEVVHLADDSDYLATDLKARAAGEQIRFTLFIQLESDDPEKTPIEDALVEWQEEVSQPTAVADLIFPIQKVTNAAKDIADQISFTPWHYVEDHRPLGNLARGRLFSYAASARGRNARPDLTFSALKAEWDRITSAADAE